MAETVWTAETSSHDGGGIHEVFADEYEAMKWLEAQHRQEKKQAAWHVRWARDDYSQKAAVEEDDEKAEWYREQAEGYRWEIGDIDRSPVGGQHLFHTPTECYLVRERPVRKKFVEPADD